MGTVLRDEGRTSRFRNGPVSPVGASFHAKLACGGSRAPRENLGELALPVAGHPGNAEDLPRTDGKVDLIQNWTPFGIAQGET